MDKFASNDEVCFIFVPGTLLPRHLPVGSDRVSELVNKNKWYLEDWPLATKLKAVFSKITIETFYWERLNSQKCRYEWACELSARLTELDIRYKKIFLIGHSHGGNVALMAAQLSNISNIGVITLATPFIEADCGLVSQRIGMLYVICTFLVMLSVTIFSIFSYISPLYSLIYIVVHGALFYFTLVILNLSERLSVIFTHDIAKLSLYFQYSVVQAPLSALTIFYSDEAESIPFEKKAEPAAVITILTALIKDKKDYILKISDFANRFNAAAHRMQVGSEAKISKYHKYLNLAVIGGCLFVSILLIYISVLFGVKIYALYALIAILLAFLIYLTVAGIFLAFHLCKLFLHEIQKLWPLTLSSLHFNENLLVSTKTQDVPFIKNPRAQIEICRVPLNDQVGDTHSDICLDPRAISEIERWVKIQDAQPSLP